MLVRTLQQPVLMGILFGASLLQYARGNPFQECHASPLYKSEQTGTQEQPWSGTREDLVSIVNRCYEENAFDSETHLGRNLCQLVPANQDEMDREINVRGNPDKWEPNSRIASLYHTDDIKYTTPTTETDDRREVAYNRQTGKIDKSGTMGTRNFAENYHNPLPGSDHKRLDMDTHNEDGGNQYKYVGILFETDPADPHKYYIVDGQTGKRLTPEQVRHMPATMSDMWKDMGLVSTVDETRILGDAAKVSRSLQKIGHIDVENSHDVRQPEDGETGSILHSLADLLETGEEIVEVREDMREDRRERKERERAERERKAAEEERLRQQQPAEQRKKSNAEQKKSDKKSEKKTSEPQPGKTTPATQPQKRSGTTDLIDFSKLNNLVSQQVSFVRGILSSGKKATSEQHARFNSLNNQYVSEFNRLKAQIANVSDPAKRSRYYSQLASINNRINSELDPLLARGESRGMFTNF